MIDKKSNNRYDLRACLLKNLLTLISLFVELAQQGEVWLGFEIGLYVDHAKVLDLTGDLNEAAMNLFAMLRLLDKKNIKNIAIKPIPNKEIGIAINDRLNRGASN